MLEVNRKIFEFLRNSQSQTVAIYGGAGAGKSYTIAQFLILKFIGETDKRFLVTRKTTPSLRLSSYSLMKDILHQLDLEVEENKMEMTWEFPLTKNRMVFKGMDDPEKIKSTEFNYIWMEEATEFDLDDYRQLRLRLRRASDRKNQIFLSFNPIFTSWLYSLVVEKPEEIDTLQVNYKDNIRFLSQDYIAQLERLAHEDSYFYKVYALGEFAQPSNLVYTNWEVCQVLPESFDEIIYGLDFGFNNPTALVEIGIKDNEPYILREIYRSQMTNADLISVLKDWQVKGMIYADSSEPARIEEIARAGFYIRPAEKSVKDGIDFIKRKRIRVAPVCSNFVKEIQGYKWKEDTKGNILDEPVKFMDHAMDAMRYAIYSHFQAHGGVGVAWL